MFRCNANVRENKSLAGSRSRQAGTQRLVAQPRVRRGRSSAGRPQRFLPLPPGIVPPGRPGLTPPVCYFGSEVFVGVNAFLRPWAPSLLRPSPRLQPSSSGSWPHGLLHVAESWPMGTGTASTLHSAGPEPHHGRHHRPSCCGEHQRAVRPQPEPTAPCHCCGLQPRFGASLVRSLDAQQSTSPPGMLSPSMRLIGGRAALLPAPRSRSVPAAGVVSTTVGRRWLPAPPAARSP